LTVWFVASTAGSTGRADSTAGVDCASSSGRSDGDTDEPPSCDGAAVSGAAARSRCGVEETAALARIVRDGGSPDGVCGSGVGGLKGGVDGCAAAAGEIDDGAEVAAGADDGSAAGSVSATAGSGRPGRTDRTVARPLCTVGFSGWSRGFPDDAGALVAGGVVASSARGSATVGSSVPSGVPSSEPTASDGERPPTSDPSLATSSVTSPDVTAFDVSSSLPVGAVGSAP
jgi:hypothetical protein